MHFCRPRTKKEMGRPLMPVADSPADRNAVSPGCGWLGHERLESGKGVRRKTFFLGKVGGER